MLLRLTKVARTHLKLQLPHIVLPSQVLVLHPETLEQIHYAMFEKNHIQQIDYIRTKITYQPCVGILLRLKGKCGTQRNHPGIIEK